MVLVAAFTWWQTRATHPLMPLRVLLDRNRGASFVVLAISGAGMFGVFLFLTYYLQLSLHYSPVQTGLGFLPMIGALMVAAQLATNNLLPRFGPSPIVTAGMALGGVGMVWLTVLDLNSTLRRRRAAAAPRDRLRPRPGDADHDERGHRGDRREDAGVASAAVNTIQQVGGSIGTALLNTLAATAATTYMTHHEPGKPPWPRRSCTATPPPTGGRPGSSRSAPCSPR